MSFLAVEALLARNMKDSFDGVSVVSLRCFVGYGSIGHSFVVAVIAAQD